MQVDILTYGHRKNIVPGMAKPAQGKTGTWIVKQVPQELMVRARIAALTQGKTVRGLLNGTRGGASSGNGEEGPAAEGQEGRLGTYGS